MGTESKKKRNQTFNNAKGIAIFLVIWGHVIQQGVSGNVLEHPIFKFIYAFHMPLFALISGYFFHASAMSRDMKKLIVPKVKKFLMLICIWNTIHYLLALLIRGDRVPALGQLLSGWISEIVNGYWFLWAILFYTVSVGIAIKRINEKCWLLGRCIDSQKRVVYENVIPIRTYLVWTFCREHVDLFWQQCNREQPDKDIT